MTESDSGPLGPRCPLSSEHDVMTIGDSQAFCLDDACKVVMFNPSKSLDDNLTGPMSFVDFSGWSKGGPDGPHA
jgi:hypothetical protein